MISNEVNDCFFDTRTEGAGCSYVFSASVATAIFTKRRKELVVEVLGT